MTLLMRPEPFSTEVNRLFNQLFSDDARTTQRWTPPMDLVEADDHFLLKADLPGMAEEDVSIEIQDGALVISGERKAEHQERGRGWFRVERSFGRFARTLTLPEGIDPDAVSADFDKGVLTVRIPKPEQRKPRRIQIGHRNGNGNGRAPEMVEGTATEK